MLTLTIKWQRLVDGENKTCPRCGNTETEIEKAYLNLKKTLSPLGIDVSLEKRELELNEFRKYPLRSNQIWIGDRTLEEWLGARTGQSQCCDVCGDAECRTVEMADQIYETIPASLIIKAGLIAAADMLPVEKNKPSCRQVGIKESKNVIVIPQFNRGIQKKGHGSSGQARE